MKKVANSVKKVKGQMKETILDKASWVIGIDVGKEKLFCALMDIGKTLVCRFDVEGSLAGYKKLLDRVKRETKGMVRPFLPWNQRAITGWFWVSFLKIIINRMY